MPDPHTPDTCTTDVVQMTPNVPRAWATLTGDGPRIIIDVPGFPVLTVPDARALRRALGVLVASVEDET